LSPHCCWNSDLDSMSQCHRLQPGDEELLIDRTRRIREKCFDCQNFLQDMEELGAQGPEDIPELFELALDELKRRRLQNQFLQSDLEARNREFQFLHEVSSTIQSSLDLDEIISLALTAITAGQGFGLNRAILLLVDKERRNLEGYVAVGPRRREDASRIWQEIEENRFSLQEMARRFFEQKIASEKEVFRDLLECLSVPLSDSDHPFIETLNSGTSRLIHNLSQEPGIQAEQVAALEVAEIILVPLKSRSRRVGLLLADNIINTRPISKHDLASLETFALPVSFAIERAALHEQLQEELDKVKEANRRLEEQQELILRMEKMALVGKIVSHFSHNVRNPLTIIGGFARSLGKNMLPQDERRHFIESIVRETRKLENFLNEALNYSDNLFPTLDLWDINQLVRSVHAELRDELNRLGITTRMELAGELPQVRIDYKQLSYCLRAVMSNAIDAMTTGGMLTLATFRQDRQLCILVEDNGRGISPEEMEAFREPFSAPPGKAAGLSLSLCSRIAESHDGNLQIESESGKGTRVRICIPLP